MLRRVRKLGEISPGEWLLLPQLILFSLAAAIALRLMGLPRLIRFIARCAVKPWFSYLPALHSRHEAQRLTLLVDLAARVTHGQRRCLARSLLLFWLLKARGEPAEILVGVSREPLALHSHAWIENRGKVMGDSPEVTRRFATFFRF
jgi:hypothetical protein